MKNEISPELKLATTLPEQEREKSLDLNIGYTEEFDEWELIVRYSGNLEDVKRELSISVEELLGGYAILRVPKSKIERLFLYPQIDYVEKPKNLILTEMEGVGASCINRVRLPDYHLTGSGVLVALLDSGLDYYLEDFQREDGSTRVAALWDQAVPGNPPAGFTIGSEYGREEIDRAIRLGRVAGRELVPEQDSSGHGTAVLGVMAGNGRSSGGEIVGVAPEAEIVVVKLGNPSGRGFPRTTQLMLGIDYAVRYAISHRKPIAINISFGNNYGAHNGESMLERYIDTISGLYRVSVCSGAGNDAITGRHKGGKLQKGQEEMVELNVAEYMAAFNLQIWKSYQDEFALELESPEGKRISLVEEAAEVQQLRFGGETVAVCYSQPTPYNSRQEIYLSWIPKDSYITAGIWRLIIKPKRIVSGQYDMWLPVRGSTSAEVSFLKPTLSGTLVIPSTAGSVISVAAYNSIQNTPAPFSGRGMEISRENPLVKAKPDLAAPGVYINSCRAGGGYGLFTGTSFAAPFVTGAAALLMQWGIVDGNDPYMYGEKIRASLTKGARRLSFQQEQPSSLVGWGALCVKDSIPS